jgi:hypothetical protein
VGRVVTVLASGLLRSEHAESDSDSSPWLLTTLSRATINGVCESIWTKVISPYFFIEGISLGSSVDIISLDMQAEARHARYVRKVY